MGNKISKREILDRIKQRYGLDGNAELSKFLGIAHSTLSNWYSRDSIDFDVIFTKCENVNFNWLFTAKGGMMDVIPKTTEEKTAEEPDLSYTGPPGCKFCDLKDEIITSLRDQVDVQTKLAETQAKMINYLEENNSSNEVEQKRKVATSRY